MENSMTVGREKGRGLSLPLIMLVAMLAAIAVLAYILLFGRERESKPATPATASFGESRPVASAPEAGAERDNFDFNDGLRNPGSAQKFDLDEFGEGIASIEIFDTDINGDGAKDRITRTRFENGTAHFHYDYKIELNVGGKFVDITPDGFRTVEGADCSLQKLRFSFIPFFQVVKISRPWEETWAMPTMASKTVYSMSGNELRAAPAVRLKKICNVSDLF